MKTASLWTLSLVALVGCGGHATYNVRVNGLSEPNPSGKSFVLRSGVSNVSETDLQFREFAATTEQALVRAGFDPTTPERADLVVFLSYGIGAPRTSYDVTTDIFRREIVAITEYTRWVVVEAMDAKAWRDSQRTVQTWKTTITSAGVTTDLRTMFPVLIAAGQAYFAKDTGRVIARAIDDDDPALLEINAHRK